MLLAHDPFTGHIVGAIHPESKGRKLSALNFEPVAFMGLGCVHPSFLGMPLPELTVQFAGAKGL